MNRRQKNIFLPRTTRKNLAWAGAHNPFFVHGKRGKFVEVFALTDKPAPAKLRFERFNLRIKQKSFTQSKKFGAWF